jgi:putative endonuclease
MGNWHLYILLCADKSLYVGITQDVEERLKKHRSGKGSKYVASRLPVTLVFVIKNLPLKEVALDIERYLKTYVRSKKDNLVQADDYSLSLLKARLRQSVLKYSLRDIQVCTKAGQNSLFRFPTREQMQVDRRVL